MADTDGVDELAEAFDGQLRVFVNAATHLGDVAARMLAERRRAIRMAAEESGRDLQTRLAAERAAARAQLANVNRDEWWRDADVEKIANTYELARAWAGEEPEAARAEQRMRAELHARFGVDVDNTGADPAAVREAIERRQRDRDRGDEERRRAQAEVAEASQLAALADRADARAREARLEAEQSTNPDAQYAALVDAGKHARAAAMERSEAAVTYDSAERRAGTAAELHSRVDDEPAVDARMRADVSQAKPAPAAVSSGRASSLAKGRARGGRGKQLQRGGLER